MSGGEGGGESLVPLGHINTHSHKKLPHTACHRYRNQELPVPLACLSRFRTLYTGSRDDPPNVQAHDAFSPPAEPKT